MRSPGTRSTPTFCGSGMSGTVAIASRSSTTSRVSSAVMILVQEAGAISRSGCLLQSTSPESRTMRMPVRALTSGGAVPVTEGSTPEGSPPQAASPRATTARARTASSAAVTAGGRSAAPPGERELTVRRAPRVWRRGGRRGPGRARRTGRSPCRAWCRRPASPAAAPAGRSNTSVGVAALRMIAVRPAPATTSTGASPAICSCLTTSPAATIWRLSYSAEPHVRSATASFSSWSRVGSRMVTTISGTSPGLPDPTSTLSDCFVDPVLMPSPQG